MSFLYWLYLWQLKEYRWDRMRAHLQALPLKRAVELWLVGQWRRPQITVKIGLIALAALTLIFGQSLWLIGLGFGWLTVLLMAYLTLPLAVGLSTGLLAVPSRLTTALLVYAAVRKRGRFTNLLVIGVAGSYGKTTTKEAIAALLSTKFKVLKTRGGVNTKIGIARQILFELKPEIQVYVVEMGAYRRGEIAELTGLIRPRIGVLTGINKQHLALFGSLKNIKQAKFELLERLPSNGLAVINVADLEVASLKGQIRVEILEYESKAPWENIRAAIKIAEYLDLSAEEIQIGQTKFRASEKRLQVKKGIKGAVVIDDTYSSNPDGFRTALKTLKDYAAKRKVLITSGVYELGAEAERINRELHDRAVSFCDVIVVTEPLHASYFPLARLVEDDIELFDLIKETADPETVFLFEGRNRVINQAISKMAL